VNDIEYIGRLPRALAIAVGLRQISPRPDRIPDITNLRHVEPIDTGGAFRPDWRKQDPAADPKEPYGGESSGTGNDHGWSNCTAVSAAIAFAYQVQDKSGPQGGDMRHNQDDLSGGTDLYDMRTAWDRYGNQTLTIKSGAGWAAVKTAHNEGRAIIIQGEGNVPGSESFDGGHACIIGAETHSDGRWLWGDPLADGWQWVKPSDIETWAERLSSGIYFAVSKKPATTTPPQTTPPPPMEILTYPPKPASTHDVEAYQSELLSDYNYWFTHPETEPPFPIADMLAMVRNAGWDVGKWNQTTWHLDPTAAKWGEALWSGTTETDGGHWA
jgi:hypothetical protein